MFEMQLQFNGICLFLQKNRPLMKKPDEKISVLIADKQYLTAIGLKSIFHNEFEVKHIGVADSYLQILHELQNQHYTLLVADNTIFEKQYPKRIGEILSRFPGLLLLIITNKLDLAEFHEMKKCKIRNIIFKSVSEDEFNTAVNATLHKIQYYSEELIDQFLESENKKDAEPENYGLTPSEIDVVKLIACGYSNKEIADRKNVSIHTITTHRRNVFRKMGVNNSSELIIAAIKAGWVDNIEYTI
jgi:DNA-binding NarL/FixJ family response regulator